MKNSAAQINKAGPHSTICNNIAYAACFKQGLACFTVLNTIYVNTIYVISNTIYAISTFFTHQDKEEGQLILQQNIILDSSYYRNDGTGGKGSRKITGIPRK